MAERGGVFLGSLTFGGQVASDKAESSSRIGDGKNGTGEVILDLEILPLGT